MKSLVSTEYKPRKTSGSESIWSCLSSDIIIIMKLYILCQPQWQCSCVEFLVAFGMDKLCSNDKCSVMRISQQEHSPQHGNENALGEVWTWQTLHWRHNDHEGVSNHQPHGCLLNRLFRRRSKKTSKLRVTGLCVGNSPGPVNSPHKGPVTRKMFPFDDFIMVFILTSMLVTIGLKINGILY